MILDQSEYWVDAHGVRQQLDDMSPSYRANLLNFIRRRAQHFQSQGWLEYLSAGWPEDPSDGVWSAMVTAEAELDGTPTEWIERTPLVCRLVELERVGPVRLRVHNRLYGLTHPGWRARRNAFVESTMKGK